VAQPLAINPDSSFIGPPMNLYVQLLALTLAGWVNRHQKSVIEYLQAENRSPREQLGPKRLRWTDAQRRRLAEKAKAVSRDGLDQLGPIVTPDTLLRWYRRLGAASPFTFSATTSRETGSSACSSITGSERSNFLARVVRTPQYPQVPSGVGNPATVARFVARSYLPS